MDRCISRSRIRSALGEFQYLRNTLGADEVQLGSLYDYESAALLYIANDIQEPNQNGYQQTLDRTIINTAKATGGRMLELFTSYAALKKTANLDRRVLIKQYGRLFLESPSPCTARQRLAANLAREAGKWLCQVPK